MLSPSLPPSLALILSHTLSLLRVCSMFLGRAHWGTGCTALAKTTEGGGAPKIARGLQDLEAACRFDATAARGFAGGLS